MRFRFGIFGIFLRSAGHSADLRGLARWLALTLVELELQVDTSFSSFGHPTQVDTSRSQWTVYAWYLRVFAAWTCESTCEFVWPPIASSHEVLALQTCASTCLDARVHLARALILRLLDATKFTGRITSFTFSLLITLFVRGRITVGQMTWCKVAKNKMWPSVWSVLCLPNFALWTVC